MSSDDVRTLACEVCEARFTVRPYRLQRYSRPRYCSLLCANVGRRGGAHAGEKNGNARLTEDRVRWIRRDCMAGDTQAAVALRYGISQPLVCRVVNGQAWSHVQ